MFDEEKAKRTVDFINCLKHTKGKWRGQPFELLPWQEAIIRDVFGTAVQHSLHRDTEETRKIGTGGGRGVIYDLRR